MDTSLLTSDGFPRDDIDVAQSSLHCVLMIQSTDSSQSVSLERESSAYAMITRPYSRRSRLPYMKTGQTS